MSDSLPHSPAADRNAEPIAAVLHRVLRQDETVMEIGAGTGQHAVYFAQHFPSVLWLPTDVEDNIPTIAARVSEARLPNLLEPEALDVFDDAWPSAAPTVIYTANTLHIMPPQGWPRLIERAAALLRPAGKLIIYGPFRYRDRELEISNQRFEQWLQSEASHRALRLQEDVVEYAATQGLSLLFDEAMPANNRCLVFEKQG